MCKETSIKDILKDDVEDARKVVERLDKFVPVLVEVVEEMWKEYKDEVRAGECCWDTNGWAIGCWRDLLQEKVECIGDGIRAYDKDKDLNFTYVESVEYRNLVNICLLACFGIYHCKDLGAFRSQELLKMFSRPESNQEGKE